MTEPLPLSRLRARGCPAEYLLVVLEFFRFSVDSKGLTAVRDMTVGFRTMKCTTRIEAAIQILCDPVSKVIAGEMTWDELRNQVERLVQQQNGN